MHRPSENDSAPQKDSPPLIAPVSHRPLDVRALRGIRGATTASLLFVLLLVAGLVVGLPRFGAEAIGVRGSHPGGSVGVGPALRGDAGGESLGSGGMQTAPDSIAVFGPREFGVPSGGGTAFHVETFSLPVQPDATYTLVVENGDGTGADRVDAATLVLNGDTLLAGPLGTPDVRIFDAPPVASPNDLQLEVTGPDGAHLSATLWQSTTPTFVVFGPVEYLRSTGQPQPEDVTFTVDGAAPPFHLYLESGYADGTDRVTSGTVTLNGLEIFGTSAFDNTVSALDAAVDLQLSNTLSVELAGEPDSRMSIHFTGQDTVAPVLQVTAPADSAITSDTTVLVSGTVDDLTAVQVDVAGLLLPVDSAGGFGGEVPLTLEGSNDLLVTATDAAGNVSSTSVTVIRDTEAPVVTLSSPAAGAYVGGTTVTVSGSAQDITPVTATVNGVQLLVADPNDYTGAVETRTFSGEIPLDLEGANILTITVTDAAGNVFADTREVIRDTEPPVLSVSEPVDGTTTSDAEILVSGTVTDTSPVTVTMAGEPVTVDGSGFFQTTLPLVEGSNSISVVATDAVNLQTTVSVSVTRESGEEELPPDPSTVAPDLSENGPTPTADATSFLYVGSDPIQRDVVAGAIDTVQAAVARGRVLERDGSPLPGVRVEVLHHPELGYTLSRADGGYDLAVNGGGKVTLNFSDDAVLPAQRTVEVPWQDYFVMDDVRLVSRDTAATVVDLPSLTEPAVARGSVETDLDGPRQATVLFEPGTEATMVLPDGAIDTLTTLSVRATEYTVGEDGPEAMPAPLPPASHYTYAVELSVDEAEAAGAETVQFSRPVPFYVENFLAFPVGIDVPAAWLDQDRGTWVPMDDGRVVEILSVDGGVAAVDADGDGVADDDTTLEALGLDPGERTTLAESYGAGTQLWRVELEHFTAVDLNFSFRILGGGEEPEPEIEETEDNDPEDDPCTVDRSIVECENRILGERIGLVGTSMNLNYRSDRASGNVHEIRVPLTDSILPDSLRAVIYEVRIAGRAYGDTLAPEPNLERTIVWDGTDVYGRRVWGGVVANVAVGYVYPAEFTGPPEAERAFALSCGAALEEEGLVLSSCEMDQAGSGSVRYLSTLWGNRSITLESAAPPGDIGGWSLSEVHAYDPVSRVLYRGDGTRRRTEDLPPVLQRVAGIPGSGGYDGDGGLAREAMIGTPTAMLPMPDGSLILAGKSGGNVYLRKIENDTITTISQTPECGTAEECVDGSLEQARFDGILDLELAPDGSIYAADDGAIRRISPDGIVSTVVGDYSGVFSGHGVPASEAGIGVVYSVAAAGDGTIYYSEADFAEPAVHIRRISPDGFVRTVAGGRHELDENHACWGDGVIAVGACLEIVYDVDVGEDGSLYLMDFWRLMRLRSDGILERVAGKYTQSSSEGYCVFLPDGSDAGSATTCGTPFTLVGEDRPVFYSEPGFSARVRTIDDQDRLITVAGGDEDCEPEAFDLCGEGGSARAALLGDNVEEITEGPDGALFFLDDFSLRIVQKITPPLPRFTNGEMVIVSQDGTERYIFDRTGRHLSTEDAVTNATLATFQYDSAGRLSAVVDGDGLATTIERAGDGTPTAVVAPFGQRTELTLNADTLLATVEAPDAALTTLGYGAGGLLTSIIRPRGNENVFVYDDDGRLDRDTDPAGGFIELVRTEFDGGYEVAKTTALGRTTTHRVEELFDGTITRQVTNPAGLTTESIRDFEGLLRTTSPDGTVVEQVQGPDPRFGMQAPLSDTLRTITPGGLTMSVTTSRATTLADSSDVTSLVSVDDSVTVNGRLYRSVFDAGSLATTTVSPEGRTTTSRQDSLGRVVSTTTPGIDSVTYAYDGSGRLTQIAQGTRTSTFTYGADGFLESTTDPLTRTDSLFYDPAGRVTRQVLRDGEEIAYGYDAEGNLTSLAPPGRPAHTFTYNAVGLDSIYDPPDVAGVPEDRTFYSYNLDRDLTQILRPDGLTVDFAYDPAGRADAVTVPRGVVDYAYSATTGQLTGITAPGAESLSFAYDGSLPTQETWTGTVSGQVGFAYDNDFRLSGLAVNGDTLAYAYDQDGLLTQAGDLALTRDPLNGLLTETQLDSVTTRQSYNTFGELAADSAWVGSTLVFARTYTRDDLGRIIDVVDVADGVTTTWGYGYDLAGRLETVTQNGQAFASYEYDANGNRLSRTSPSGVESGTYDAQDRLVSYDGASYSYTAAGELEEKVQGTDTTRYTYDVLGNLIEVTLPDGTLVEYVIDGRNRRVGKKVDGSLVQGLLYGDQLNPVAELDSLGNVVSRFVYGSKANVPDYVVRGGETFRVNSDHLGSVRLVVNVATGAVVQRLSYDAWGRVLEDTNPGWQPFGFAGGIHDADVGLVRFGARDYSSREGRWTAKDPIGFAAASSNLFSYALNDPIDFLDVDGEHPLFIAAGVGAVLGGTFGGLAAVASGGDVSAAIFTGALTGASVALTPSRVLVRAAAGGLAGLINNAVAQVTNPCRPFSPGQLAFSGAAGAAFGTGAALAGGAIGSTNLVPATTPAFTSFVGQFSTGLTGLVSAGVTSAR